MFAVILSKTKFQFNTFTTVTQIFNCSKKETFFSGRNRIIYLFIAACKGSTVPFISF